MCGINGIFDIKKCLSTEKIGRIVHDMNDRISHRGPDSEGLFCESNISLGMRRLSIIDVDNGSQPMANEAGNLVIVYNGEVYNYKNIREQLTGIGYSFKTDSDTEVVLKAYEEYGYDVFDMLDGMFGLAIYDKNTKKLVIARDRLGEKPLYYAQSDNGCFVWGSELKSLLATKLLNPKISKVALNYYLQLTYIPAPHCIFEGIKKVEPGTMVTIYEDGTIEPRRYWDIREIEKRHISYEKARTELKEKVVNSVRLRMNSDVPLGAFLSGGIDSGIVVSVMAKNSHKPIETFTIGFDEKEYDETERARIIANHNNTNHHEKKVEYTDVLEVIEDISKQLDEPFADTSVIPTFYVSRFTQKDVKVALTGDGADELFLGYDKYLIGYYNKILDRFPKFAINLMKSLVNLTVDTSTISRKVRKVLENVGRDIADQRVRLMSLGFQEEERKALLAEGMFGDGIVGALKKQYYSAGESSSEVTRTQYVDIKTVLEGDMLAKVDRMSMVNSLETRAPFLSKDIVEFAWSIPDEYKLCGRNKKRILKDAFEDMLPDSFCKLPKSGFGIPLDYWFRTSLNSWVHDLLSQESIEKEGFFNWGYVKSLIEEHEKGIRNNKNKIWTLIVFEKWYKHFMSVYANV